MSQEQFPEAVFTREGRRYVPTDLARGPWHPDSQHGSAMAGVLAHAIEHAPSELVPPLQVVRLTMELIRAAPFAPVEVEVQTTHRGKTVELIEARLLAAGELCAIAHAVRYRVVDLSVGDAWAPRDKVPPLDPSARVPLPKRKTPALHDALHLSPANGFEKPILWVRMLRPLVAGEALTPLVRLAVALDWGYAALQLRGMMLDPSAMAARPFVPINTDNHVALMRPPEGEWICLDASTVHGGLGAGVTNLRVFDEAGVLGYGTQTSLLRGLEKRPKAWRE